MKILLTIPHECLDEARGKNLYESYFYENIFKKILVVISYKFFNIICRIETNHFNFVLSKSITAKEKSKPMEGRTKIPDRKRKSSDGDIMSSESSGSDSDYGTLDGTDRVPLMKMVYCNAEDLECNMPGIELERYANECALVYVPQDLPQDLPQGS